jgi:hypothetical protein
MACSLSITSVTGLSAGGITTAIRVTGTLGGECTPVIFSPTIKFDVVVEVDCGMGPSSATTLSSGGNWSVDVPIICSCDKTVRVKAHCASNPDCVDNFSGALQCEEQGLCPAGSISVSVDGCNPDGTRNVTLVAILPAFRPGSWLGNLTMETGASAKQSSFLAQALSPTLLRHITMCHRDRRTRYGSFGSCRRTARR